MRRGVALMGYLQDPDHSQVRPDLLPADFDFNGEDAVEVHSQAI
jgi:hypothetical protein